MEFQNILTYNDDIDLLSSRSFFYDEGLNILHLVKQEVEVCLKCYL